jgi:hypothetical protein
VNIHDLIRLGLFFDGEGNATRRDGEPFGSPFARAFAAAESSLRFALRRDSSP